MEYLIRFSHYPKRAATEGEGKEDDARWFAQEVFMSNVKEMQKSMNVFLPPAS